MNGLFITFEGTEGCGKSTQIERLAKRLRGLGHAVTQLREPGGTPIGEELRHTLKHSQQNHAMTPEAELLLMTASRAQLIREVIRPSLLAGGIVLCDRFYDSTTAYQGYGRGLDLKWIKTLTQFAVGKTKPNLTFFLRISEQAGQARVSSRNTDAVPHDRIEQSGAAFFKRVAKGYKRIARAEPRRVKVIDGGGSIEKVEAVFWHLVETRLTRR
jgi:dTMP kinase